MAYHIIILDFGSQYTQVIARRIRELKVYSEILPFDTPINKIREKNPAGIILSGGPLSVYSKKAPLPSPDIFTLGIPLLGICYGMQVFCKFLGGRVERGTKREYGEGKLVVKHPSPLFLGLPPNLEIWNSHGDKLNKAPTGFITVAKTKNAPHAAIEDPHRQFYGLQFHPEVSHTPRGKVILSNFTLGICKAKKHWTMRNFIEENTKSIREKVGTDRVILGLSGGVDSSVCAALLHRSLGNKLECIFVDNGLLRKNEKQKVQEVFGKHLKIKLHTVDAAATFLKKLKGVTDPEKKRKIIGKEFIRIFEEQTKKISKIKFLAQGTLYPDVIESVPIGDNPASMIKSHHNVGGLPKKMKLQLIEPLRQLFKDEVRDLGERLSLPEELVWRHPFPGPGLALRCLGGVTQENLDTLREADAIVIEEIKLARIYRKIWQAFAVLLPVRSVGVMGDKRTYNYTVAVRIVQSVDGMTANWARLSHDLLEKMSSRIINEVENVGRVVYDISSKPPATIEWE